MWCVSISAVAFSPGSVHNFLWRPFTYMQSGRNAILALVHTDAILDAFQNTLNRTTSEITWLSMEAVHTYAIWTQCNFKRGPVCLWSDAVQFWAPYSWTETVWKMHSCSKTMQFQCVLLKSVLSFWADFEGEIQREERPQALNKNCGCIQIACKTHWNRSFTTVSPTTPQDITQNCPVQSSKDLLLSSSLFTFSHARLRDFSRVFSNLWNSLPHSVVYLLLSISPGRHVLPLLNNRMLLSPATYPHTVVPFCGTCPSFCKLSQAGLLLSLLYWIAL